MGRPVDMPIEAPEPAAAPAVEVVSPISVTESGMPYTIDENDTDISVSIEAKYDIQKEAMEGFPNEDRRGTIAEGVSCASEMLLLLREGLSIDKTIRGIVSNSKGESFKLTFEKI